MVPVLGTAIGAGIGGVLGGWFGAGIGAGVGASAWERAAGRSRDAPTALDQAAGMDLTPIQRRREARRERRESEDASGDRPLTATEKAIIGGPAARTVDNRDQRDQRDQSVHIDSPVIQIHSATGNPIEIADEAYERLIEHIKERVKEDLRRDEQRMLDLTYSDPDPTID